MKKLWTFCLLIGAFFFAALIVSVPAYAELTLTCDSIDPESWVCDKRGECGPQEIHVKVTPKEDGTLIPGLTTTDFTITEDGDPRVVLECTGGIGGTVDIVFAIDASYSTNDDEEMFINAIHKFLDDLENEDIDWRVGLIEFGNDRDNLGHPNPVVLNDGKLTDDRDLIELLLRHISDSNGGIEPGLDAVQLGCETFDFRPNSYRRVLVMTDENSDPSCDIQPVVDCLDGIGMIADCYIDESDFARPCGFAWQQYGKKVADDSSESEPGIGICGSTGGLVFDIGETLDDVLAEIREAILGGVEGAYDCRYTANPGICDDKQGPQTIPVGVTVHVAEDEASCGLSYIVECPIIDCEIELTPESAVNTEPGLHTVTATITCPDDISPAGIEVDFSIESGPNTDADGTCSPDVKCITDAKGQVNFTYEGTKQGTDKIEACFEEDRGKDCGEALKVWQWECPDYCEQTFEDGEFTLERDLDCTKCDFCFKLKRATMVMDCFECIGAKVGIILENSSELRGGTVRDCGVGIAIEGNNNSVIVMRSFNNRRDGLQVAGNYNKIKDSVFGDNGAAGIEVEGANNSIYGNEAYGNAEGIKVENGARTNYLFNNGVDKNKGPGIHLQRATNNLVRGNYIERNQGAGIWAEITAFGNKMKSNYSMDNNPDMKDGDWTCSQNTWQSNYFGTYDPSCIR